MALFASFCFPLESSWALLKPSLLRLSPSCSPLVPLWNSPGSHCPLLWDPPGPHFAPLGLSWLPLGHDWSLRNCVTVVEFICKDPFCQPPDPPGASCPPLGSSCPPFASFGNPPEHYWGAPGPVCDPPAALWFPFETLLDLIAPPLGPFWASLPPLWDPPGSLCPPWDTPGALWLTVGPPYASVSSSCACRNCGTVEKSQICALFSYPNPCLPKT